VPRERPAAQQVQLVRGHVLRANARISPRGRASWEPGQPRRRSAQPMAARVAPVINEDHLMIN